MLDWVLVFGKRHNSSGFNRDVDNKKEQMSDVRRDTKILRIEGKY